MTPNSKECAEFVLQKLVPGLLNFENKVVTPDMLRYMRDEISLFLGDGLPESTEAT